MWVCTHFTDRHIPAACVYKAEGSFCYKECINHVDIICPFCGGKDNVRTAPEVGADVFACDNSACESYFDLEEV